MAFSISFALKAEGHQVEIVSDGQDALSELKAKPNAFDLLITDHSMPRINGIELVRQLRDTEFRGKIVILSAHLSRETTAAYMALGVDMIIPKPFDVPMLRASIRQLGDRGTCSTGKGPAALSAPQVYRLLRLGLAGSGESEETVGGA